MYPQVLHVDKRYTMIEVRGKWIAKARRCCECVQRIERVKITLEYRQIL